MLESCCRSAGAIRKCGRRSRNGRRSRQKPWRSVRTGRRGRAEYRSDWARPSGAIRETFDAVTHALLRTPLTDASGQKFGDGLSLIERVHTVKGEVSGWVYYPLYTVLIFPVYQVLLIAFGTLFGQFRFFFNIVRKMLRWASFGLLFADKKNARD